MSYPKVSVLIPCFNAEKFVGQTLESVFSQTWPNIEIIVVNDGSTDESLRVINSFDQSKLKVLEQENRGQTAALNKGLEVATGEFIQYLDADDIIAPDKIERQMMRLVQSPDCVAASEWGRFYQNVSETSFNRRKVWTDLSPLDWLADGMDMMFPAMWLIPAQLARSVGPWEEDLTLNNDAEYFTRILLACQRVLFCEGARCYYRSGLPNSLSGIKTTAGWASQFKVNERCQTHILSREDSDRMRKLFAVKWQQFAHGAYPYNPDLANAALVRARALHSVRVRPAGGPRFEIVSRLIGWRLARRLQVATGRP